MVSSRKICVALLLATALVATSAVAAYAAGQPPVNLGTSASYAVYAQHEMYNTGTTHVTGDLGLGPTSHPMPTGLVVSGTTNYANPSNADALAVLAAVRAAYADAIERSWDVTITADLGGQTLLPGVYRDQFADQGTIDLNGTLTLDAQGDPNAVWIFQSDYSLVTGANSRIVLANGARFCRVFWAVDAANLGANSTFEGHIFARGGITAGQGAVVHGQLLSAQPVGMDGAVTLNSNTIDNTVCLPYTPRLPKTGYPPSESTGSPRLLVAGGLAALILLAAVAVRRPSGRSD